MPQFANGPLDELEPDEGVAWNNGKKLPQRSRTGSGRPKSGKTRSVGSKRKMKGPNGIHQRRNKRMSW